MKKLAFQLCCVGLGFLLVPTVVAVEVRNSSFSQARGTTLTKAEVAAMRKRGWTCPDAKDWPHSWGGQGAKVKVQFPKTGGRGNDAFCRLSGGTDGYLNGYWGKIFKPSQVLEFWARGKGTLRVGLMAYKLSDDHKKILPGGTMPAFDIRVDSKQWIRYRYLMRKPSYELTGHPMFLVPNGTVDIDDVDILDSNPAFDLQVAQENLLYGKRALVENATRTKVDQTFGKRRAEYERAVGLYRSNKKKISAHLVKPIDQRIQALKPYLRTKGITTILATHYNDMIVMTRVLRKLAGASAGNLQPLQTTRLQFAGKPHYAGRRDPRPSRLTITNVRSNKVRYSENERATTVATVVNFHGKPVSGTLVARMILDLDQTRLIASAKVSALASGETKKWRFSYNVGPETYGRAIEVEFIHSNGKSLDKWQEYYAVAAEFFRVHQHAYQTKTKYFPEDPHVFYFNQTHYFAHEPTALGAEPFKAEVYITGQAGYRINVRFRQAQIAFNKTRGIASTFYVIGAFDGQMGYEQVRRHPEFMLYDPNGQPAVDPLYGGYPNPMELASPLEVGPKRKKMKIKPYLDREYRPWQHVSVNMASKDAVEWAVKRMAAYAKHWGFQGVYWDGCLGVWAGYDYRGRRNVPSGMYKDYVKLGARNHRLFNQVLKRDNPNFGTWLNWGLEGATGEFAKRHGITIWLGSGVKGDPRDDNVRAATNARNVMLLDENQGFEGQSYAKLLSDRIRSRDHYVQKYGANHIIGYARPGVNAKEPGPTKWGWPAWNYVMAQLVATQSHLAGYFLPSLRPGLQFSTRYSRFIWARDIKVVPPAEVDKLVKLTASEKLWWRRLVYQRKTNHGRDLIVHLVRIPPTPKVDYAWLDEPKPLANVNISLDPSLKLRDATMCRSYRYEESQQVTQQRLLVSTSKGRAVLSVPPFRYHAMVVLRMAK